MKKPNKLYKSIGPRSRLGAAFRNAYYHPVPSLRSAFRGVEWVIAGTFSGAYLCKSWVHKMMAAMKEMHLPYKGKKLSALFSVMAGYDRKRYAEQGVKPEIT